jgi:hypothetical protein
MPSIDEQLLKLPSLRDPFPMKLPDGTIDWRFYLPIPDFWPTPEGWKYIPGSNTGGKTTTGWHGRASTKRRCCWPAEPCCCSHCLGGGDEQDRGR